MRALIVLGAVVSVIVAVAACAEDFKDCYAEDLVACTCAGGAQGYAKCQNGSYKSSVCVCDGTTPGIDASTCSHALDAGGFKADFETCTTPDECQGCRCEQVQMAQQCTRPCASDADCPQGRCNTRGVCRGS